MRRAARECSYHLAGDFARRAVRAARAFGVLVAVACCAGLPLACAHKTLRAPPVRAHGSKPTQVDAALARLHAHERELRRSLRFERAAPATRALGPDPFALCKVGGNLLGLLRGSSELVLLDRDLHELARAPAPTTPVGCAAFGEHDVAVVGALEARVHAFRVGARSIVENAIFDLPHLVQASAVASRDGTLYVADQVSGRVFTLDASGRVPAAGAEDARRTQAPHDASAANDVGETALCRHPLALVATHGFLLANCLWDHALVVRSLDARGRIGPEIFRSTHDGPFWGISAVEQAGALVAFASGVENHALERFSGAFGYVDSFIYGYRVTRSGGAEQQAINVSDLGLLVPKALVLALAPNAGLSLSVTAYGSERMARFEFSDLDAPPSVQTGALFPGISSALSLGGELYAASPLLDAWVHERAERASLVAVEPENSSASSLRLGEALVFTRLIAPLATSAGRHSRFTCETCHFEGGVDARIHNTGRGDVQVTTRPLFGLLQNAPHFSRALDPDLASVSHNEFRVAGLGNDYDPWFSLKASDFPWLAALGVSGSLGPEELRRAFMDFLAVFEPPKNPWLASRRRFSELEALGAQVFRAHCERCHAARFVADEASSEVAFEHWEELIFSEAGPLVWARGEYEKTEVEPYVNERGTRIPSLRRVFAKYPYFTNGSARSLEQVLARYAELGSATFHAQAPSEAERLSVEERSALAAFLQLL